MTMRIMMMMLMISTIVACVLMPIIDLLRN